MTTKSNKNAPLAPLFDHSLYYREKISSALFEPTADHITMATVGIGGLADVLNKYQTGLEARGLLDKNEEWLTEINDTRYALSKVKNLLTDRSLFEEPDGRIYAYAISKMVDRMEELAKDIDKNP